MSRPKSPDCIGVYRGGGLSSTSGLWSDTNRVSYRRVRVRTNSSSGVGFRLCEWCSKGD